MTSTEILQKSAADGVLIKLSDDGTLKVAGDQQQVAKWIPAIRGHKSEIIKTLSEAVTVDEEKLILKWLSTINETDPEIIDAVLTKCRMDSDALDYFLGRRGND